jgi:hypothetical protein
MLADLANAWANTFNFFYKQPVKKTKLASPFFPKNSAR